MSFEAPQTHPADTWLDEMLAIQHATGDQAAQAFRDETQAYVRGESARGVVMMCLAMGQAIAQSIPQLVPGETVTDQLNLFGWNDVTKPNESGEGNNGRLN